MWKFLHPYAKPETQYRLLGKIQPAIGYLSLILLAIAFVLGLAFAPKDYQQGDSYRIYSRACCDLVDGRVWFNGIGWLNCVGVANSSSKPCNGFNGTNRLGICLYFACNRGNLGETNVGHLVGVGCSLNLCTCAFLSLYRCNGALLSFPR